MGLNMRSQLKREKYQIVDEKHTQNRSVSEHRLLYGAARMS